MLAQDELAEKGIPFSFLVQEQFALDLYMLCACNAALCVYLPVAS